MVKIDDRINSKFTKKDKHCRRPNFPSEISENIAKFAMAKTYGVFPNWNCKVGDLDLAGERIEVKGFSSMGPTSFGPTSKWNKLIFVDCMKFIEKIFTVIEIDCESTDPAIQNIVLNKSKNETFKDKCAKGNRPHINPLLFLNHIPASKKKIIFDGHISELQF